MRVRIFDNAKLDLVDGFTFYEDQAGGVGHYFLNSLFADIDSLRGSQPQINRLDHLLPLCETFRFFQWCFSCADQIDISADAVDVPGAAGTCIGMGRRTKSQVGGAGPVFLIVPGAIPGFSTGGMAGDLCKVGNFIPVVSMGG